MWGNLISGGKKKDLEAILQLVISLKDLEKYYYMDSLLFSYQIKRTRRAKRVRITALSHKSIPTKSYAVCRARAKQFIRDRVQVYNAYYGFSYRRISVKNLKSRWGSCSKKRNLNFHYRLLFLPIELADYVIVHELCHLKELNHSKKFWQLIVETVGDYKKKKRALHRYAL